MSAKFRSRRYSEWLGSSQERSWDVKTEGGQEAANWLPQARRSTTFEDVARLFNYGSYLALAGPVGVAHDGRRDQHPEAHETCPSGLLLGRLFGGPDRVAATGR